MRVDLPDRERGFFDNMADRPVTSTEWAPMEIQGPVAENASAVVLGAIILGGGTALDDLRLEVREGEEWIPAAALQNGDFEEGETGDLTGWLSSVTGWAFVPTEGGAPHGARHLRIVPETETISGGLFPYAPAPGEVTEKPLGLGLMARVPLALHSRDGHTMGRPSASGLRALSQALENLGLPAMTGEDEALRLANVIMAWNIFQHFYPYLDVVDTDWDGVLTAALDRALSDGTDEEHLATLRWMVSELQDGHGYVAGPVQPPAFLEMQVDWIEEQVVVVAVEEGSPLRIGDVIVSVDGVPATELLEESAAVFSGSPQWRRWRALAQFGAGPTGTEASLAVRRESGDLTLSIPRQAQPDQVNEARPENIEELEPGIFYVNLDLVELTAFQAQVEELAAARGVVFDLRGYPNGNHLALTHLTDSNLNSAFWRVPQIIYPDHDGEAHYAESRWNLPPSEPRFQGRIVFLTNGRAISYAESVMGIVEHYRLGEIVGGTTAGANGNVNPFTLPGGYRFSWTGMRVIKHDGTQHHLVGIQPTIPMTRTIQGVREGRDELLEKALEVIRGG
jgi:C-terminal processing protease CtpA/Prc